MDCRITKEYFIEKCAVEKGKYAEDLFSRMYDSIMSEIKCLDDEYDIFYKIEYENFEDYLYKRYCIPLNTCKSILFYKSQKKTFKLYEKDDFACGHYQIYELAFSEDLNERILSVLQMIDYEN